MQNIRGSDLPESFSRSLWLALVVSLVGTNLNNTLLLLLDLWSKILCFKYIEHFFGPLYHACTHLYNVVPLQCPRRIFEHNRSTRSKCFQVPPVTRWDLSAFLNQMWGIFTLPKSFIGTGCFSNSTGSSASLPVHCCCVCSRALHWVPILMPMPKPTHAHGLWVLGGHGFDIIVHGWAWVAIVSRSVWMGVASKWVHDPCPLILLETWT
jgi:hypothetical protein